MFCKYKLTSLINEISGIVRVGNYLKAVAEVEL